MHVATLPLLEDEDVLVYAARSNDLPELGIGPSDPPDCPIVLALYLVGADPLVRQEHVVDLLCDLRTCGIHRTLVAGSVREVDVGGSLPHFDVLVGRARRDSAAVVVELNVVHEVIVLQGEACQLDTTLAVGLLLRLELMLQLDTS